MLTVVPSISSRSSALVLCLSCLVACGASGAQRPAEPARTTSSAAPPSEPASGGSLAAEPIAPDDGAAANASDGDRDRPSAATADEGDSSDDRGVQANVQGALPTQLGVVDRFPVGTPDAALRAAFACASDPDDSAGFDCYARLNVVSNRDNDIARAHLRTYQWRYFRQRAASYVVRSDPLVLRVVRRDNTPSHPRTPQSKLFVKSTARDNPAPITFRLEDGEWRIYANSL